MTIKPLGEHVLLTPQKQAEKTEAGLYRPDTADDQKSQEAEVIAVGDNAPVKKGDIVLYKKYSGDEFERDGETYVVVKNEDIIALLQ